MDWRTLDPQDLERHFNPRLATPDFQRFFDEWDRLGDAALARLKPERDIRYGDGPLQTLDLYRPARANAPVLLLIHGGYWRGLDKRGMSFAIEPFAAAGAMVVNINYDLCPSVTLDQIVAEVHQAVAWVRGNAARYGGDPARIVLLGHSAGAHLAAMCLGEDEAFRGLVAISGIYELEPVLGVSVNADIRLDPAMARRNSPTLHPPAGNCPMLIAAGDAEPEGWIAQSADFHAACRGNGRIADFWRLGGENHFSILLALADPRHPLTAATLKLVGC